jgi:hypothetical protein
MASGSKATRRSGCDSFNNPITMMVIYHLKVQPAFPINRFRLNFQWIYN